VRWGGLPHAPMRPWRAARHIGHEAGTRSKSSIVKQRAASEDDVTLEHRGEGMAEKIPNKIGKYEIKRILGRGTMGVVYLAYDPFVQRRVAIKVARTDFLQDDASISRYLKAFFNEAHAAGKLVHPHIVSIFDAGIDGDLRYIVMEFVRGHTLKAYCTPGSLLPIENVVDIVFKCCKALEYAHGKGVIHRDIKPTNIMLSDGNVAKIMDFSIAQLSMADETQPMGLVGSPTYMSPEQVKEEHVSIQTDLYSLGAIMYELLTGHPPFSSPNIHSLIYKIIHQKPRPIQQLRPEVPDLLIRIVEHALEKELDKRFSTGHEFAIELAKAFNSLRYSEQQIADEEKFNTLKMLCFFRDFSNDEIQEVIHASTWLNYPADTAIITEGDIDDSFYILTDGAAEVRKNNKVISTLARGDGFGEIGFLTKASRSASIYSKTPVTLMKVSASLIEQASMGCQLRFHKVFLTTIIERLARSTEMLEKVGRQDSLTAEQGQRGASEDVQVF
jgi:serine/threonine protein kinase